MKKCSMFFAGLFLIFSTNAQATLLKESTKREQDTLNQLPTATIEQYRAFLQEQPDSDSAFLEQEYNQYLLWKRDIICAGYVSDALYHQQAIIYAFEQLVAKKTAKK